MGNRRRATHTAWRIGVLSTRWIILGVTVQAVLQLTFTYIPAMNTVFGTAPIGVDVWLCILTLAVAVSLVVAVHKSLRRPRGQIPRRLCRVSDRTRFALSGSE